jgi:hypothetical protein
VLNEEDFEKIRVLACGESIRIVRGSYGYGETGQPRYIPPKSRSGISKRQAEPLANQLFKAADEVENGITSVEFDWGDVVGVLIKDGQIWIWGHADGEQRRYIPAIDYLPDKGLNPQ